MSIVEAKIIMRKREEAERKLEEERNRQVQCQEKQAQSGGKIAALAKMIEAARAAVQQKNQKGSPNSSTQTSSTSKDTFQAAREALEKQISAQFKPPSSGAPLPPPPPPPSSTGLVLRDQPTTGVSLPPPPPPPKNGPPAPLPAMNVPPPPPPPPSTVFLPLDPSGLPKHLSPGESANSEQNSHAPTPPPLQGRSRPKTPSFNDVATPLCLKKQQESHKGGSLAADKKSSPKKRQSDENNPSGFSLNRRVEKQPVGKGQSPPFSSDKQIVNHCVPTARTDGVKPVNLVNPPTLAAQPSPALEHPVSPKDQLNKEQPLLPLHKNTTAYTGIHPDVPRLTENIFNREQYRPLFSERPGTNLSPQVAKPMPEKKGQPEQRNQSLLQRTGGSNIRCQSAGKRPATEEQSRRQQKEQSLILRLYHRNVETFFKNEFFRTFNAPAYLNVRPKQQKSDCYYFPSMQNNLAVSRSIDQVLWFSADSRPAREYNLFVDEPRDKHMLQTHLAALKAFQSQLGRHKDYNWPKDELRLRMYGEPLRCIPESLSDATLDFNAVISGILKLEAMERYYEEVKNVNGFIGCTNNKRVNYFLTQLLVRILREIHTHSHADQLALKLKANAILGQLPQ